MFHEQVDMEKAYQHFIDDMNKGLNGVDSSLQMIPTFIESNNEIPVNRKVIVLDAGGTNFRVALIHFDDDKKVEHLLKQYWNSNEILQDLHDDFIENTISNFYLPFGIAPNFVINGKDYTIPMVIEESSVVAAASLVAKFWSTRGGFKAEVISTVKIGQVHFMYNGDFNTLSIFFNSIKVNSSTLF